MAARDIDFGLGVFHLGVLEARLRRRKRMLTALGLASALGLIAIIASYPLRPLLYGSGALYLDNVGPDAAIRIDGRPITDASRAFAIVAGTHTVQVDQEGYYPQELRVVVERDASVHVHIPPGRPRPAVYEVPLPGPSAAWKSAAPDLQGGWRLVAALPDIAPTPDPARPGAAPPLPAQVLLRVNDSGITRLASLESYAAADELITHAGRFWAAWTPNANELRPMEEGGVITIITPWGNTSIPTSDSVTGIWWGPEGRWLLAAARYGSGQNVYVWSSGEPTTLERALTPVATVPGTIFAVHWSPGGHAAAILSQSPPVKGQQRRAMDATLIIPSQPVNQSRTITLSPAPPAMLGLPPLAWSRDALWWTTSAREGVFLEHIPFRAALPNRIGRLPDGIVALTVIDDEHVRLITQDRTGRLHLETWPEGQRLAMIDDIPARPPASAVWRGAAVLISDGPEHLWHVIFDEATIR